MLKNPKLRDELNALAQAKDWTTLRSWFGIFKDEDEKLDKFFLWCHFFLPHHFRDQSPIFHREIARAYFSKENEYEAAPRGFSKTTLFEAGVMFDCVNEMEQFIVVIEKTFTEASEMIGVVREECVDNKLIIAVYGDLLANEKSLVLHRKSKSPDAEGDVIVNGVRLRAKGFDSPIRGLKSREWRPTKILCDDLEQSQHINSPEQRAKYAERYNKDVIPTVDTSGCVKVFGTILHGDSLLTNLIALHKGRIFRAFYVVGDKEWTESEAYTKQIVVPGIGPVRLLWASRWSWELLMKKRADMVSANLSNNAFEQEYRNNPIAEEERKFKWEWLWNPERVIRLSDLKKSGKVLVGYAVIDPAESLADTADFTAAIVILIDPDGNWYRVDVRNERRNINGNIDLIFEIWEAWHKYGLVKIGFEKKAFADQVKPLLDAAKSVRGVYPVVEELKAMGRRKEDRIMGALQGRYEHGKIWTVTDDRGVPVGSIDPLTQKTATDTLKEQLYNFPASKNDDLSDAEAYISDIAVTPQRDENEPAPHRDPSDDPFEPPKAMRDPFEDGATISGGQYDHDADPY